MTGERGEWYIYLDRQNRNDGGAGEWYIYLYRPNGNEGERGNGIYTYIGQIEMTVSGGTEYIPR